MKKIKLTEAQFHLLLKEAAASKAPDFKGGDIVEYPGSEVTTTAPVTNQNGDKEYGKLPTGDEVDKMMPNNDAWKHFGIRGAYR